ncbi:MAG: S8 family serine peptidase, partial [Bdellovibrionales bacterium]|nr:S8 family serine peptidase [Bdellovibrionales bacterium]
TVPGGGFAVASGTSQAAPHVAGALAALLVGYPNARLSQLKRLLVSAGDLRARDPLSTVLAPRLHFGDAALAPSQGFVRKDDGRIPIVAFDIPGVQDATNASFSLFAGEESSASVYSMVTGTNLNLGVSSHFGLVDTIHHRWWEFGFSNTSGSLQDGFAEITFVLPAALQGIFSHFHFQLVGWEPTQVGEVPAGFVLGKKSSVQVELP